MNTATLIRPATNADWQGIAKVHFEGWLPAYEGIMDAAFLASLTLKGFEEHARMRLQELKPGYVSLVAEDQGQVIGFTRAGPTRSAAPTGDPVPPGFTDLASAELYAIYLHPSVIGKGIGAALLHATAKALLDAGHKKLCVWVLTENHRSFDWYRRRGARPVAEAPITLGGVAYPQTGLLWDDLRSLAG